MERHFTTCILVLIISLLLTKIYASNQVFSETTTTTTPIEDNPEPQPKDKPFLLPTSIRPIRYDLQIIPILEEPIPIIENIESSFYNLSRFDAPGEVWIYLKCVEKTDNITLHAHQDVKIDSNNIKIYGNKRIEVANVTRDNETDFLIIFVPEPICETKLEDEAEIILNIKFRTKIASDRLNGLYLDYYIEPKTEEKRYLSTTLFAPNHARKAFPCFDEPSFKANFSISIGRNKSGPYSSISNMPLTSRAREKEEDRKHGLDYIDDLEGYVWDRFETTPPIPTYIVAMITTDFASRSVKHGDIEVKLHAPEYLLKQTNRINASKDFFEHKQNPYILQDPLLFIEDMLKTLSKLGLPYPLSKLDIIALPHFFYNAMENLGAVTFKYPVILNIENVTTVSELLKLNFVAGHEMVHQWFGNMLTPSSWSYVWLKESFSDYFARNLVAIKLYGHENDEDFLNNELQIALRYDQGPDTHPLENNLKVASDVGEIYTDIPYRKGASIVRMIHKFLQNDTFFGGLESLLKEKKFSNFDQNDVFKHFEQSRISTSALKDQWPKSVTVNDLLDSWTKQCGYPVVQVRIENGKLHLKQNFFVNDPFQSSILDKSLFPGENNTVVKMKCLNDSNQEQFWWIPVTLVGNDELSQNHSIIWMPPSREELTVVVEEGSRITNTNGYFRILYSNEILESKLKNLMRVYLGEKYSAYGSSGNSALERSQLLDDYFAFAFFLNSNKVPVSQLFNMISLLMPYESEQVVWNTFFANIKLPHKLFQGTPHFPQFQKYVILLLKPLHHFLQSQVATTLSNSCTHPSAFTKRMKLVQFNANIFNWLCNFDAEECLIYGKPLVDQLMKTGEASLVPADVQSAVFCAVVKHASGKELNSLWNFFEKLYFNEFYSVQRDRYLKALSCTQDENYLQRLLHWTVNETLEFHDVDRVTLIKYVISNPMGREIVLTFLSENFKVLYKSASVANPVTEALKALVEYTNSLEKLAKMEDFIKKHTEAMEKKKKFLDKQRRNAKLNILWMMKMGNEIQKSCEHHLATTFAIKGTSCFSHQSLEEHLSKLVKSALSK